MMSSALGATTKPQLLAIRLTSLLGPGAGDVVSEPTDSAEPEAALESVAVVDAAFFPFLNLGAGFGLWNFFWRVLFRRRKTPELS